MANTKDKSKNSVRTVRHKPIYDSNSLNNAMDRSINDQNFLDSSLDLLAGLKFPAFKSNIVDYVKESTSDSDVISLFESLDGYIQFRDQYHVRKALEENNPKKKMANQITDGTRQDPVHIRKNHATTKGIKDSQAVNESEERKDFPEVTPTAMSDFICKKCGKSYQTPDDLARHKKFEEGEIQYKKVSDKSRIDRQQTTRISSEEISSSTQESTNKALNKDAASRIANLLEGLDFPVTKEKIINHIHGKLDNAGKDTINDILKLIQSKLQNNVKYNSVYEVEKAANLVVEIR